MSRDFDHGISDADQRVEIAYGAEAVRVRVGSCEQELSSLDALNLFAAAVEDIQDALAARVPPPGDKQP